MKNIKHIQNYKRNHGFGLVELLIAVGLSTIVTIAIVQLFSQNKSSYLVHESATRLHENGRYAIQSLTNAVRSADFWGCRPSFQVDTQNDPGWPSEPVSYNVAGIPDIGVPGIVSGVAGIEGGVANGLAGYPTQPDTLVISGIRRGRSYALDANTGDNFAGPLTINIGNRTESGIQANELLVISDCTNAQVFQVTNQVDNIIGPSADGTHNVASLAHAAAPLPTTPPSNFNNIDGFIKKGYSPDLTTIFQGFAANVTYTVNPAFDHDGNPLTLAEPTLMRTENGGIAQALVPGVETMQLVFGEDTNVPYDNQADRYVTADNVTDWEAVVSVRISLLIRTPDANSSAAAAYSLDGVNVAPGTIPAAPNGLFYSHKVYSTTITVRNRMS